MYYKLLIVDDEPDIVSMLASFFSGKGYQILTAHSGAEALKKIEQAPDLILLDINMPKKEFEIVELLSQNPGQVFDKERIYEKVWGYDSEGDSGVVAEHIRRIRAKIAVYTDRPYIETVWGCGYRWSR